MAELNQARAEARRLSTEVLKVRDELLVEHEKLAGELDQTRISQEGNLATLTRERDELRASHERALEQLERLEKERNELPQKLAQLRREWHEEREGLSTQINAAYQTRDEYLSRHDEMALELAAAAQSQQEKAAREFEALTKEHTALAGETETLGKRSQEDTEARLQTLERQLSQLHEAHAVALEALELSHKQQLQGAVSAGEAALLERDRTIAGLHEQAARLAAEREQLAADKAARIGIAARGASGGDCPPRTHGQGDSRHDPGRR